MSEIVYGGFTQDQLSEAFDLVKDRENWKMPVEAVVPRDADRNLIEAAVIFYTGSIPQFVNVKGGLGVVASGYYAEVGS